MIEIRRNSDRRADIEEVWYAHADNLEFVDYPGANCHCVGQFEQVKFSTAEIEENDQENGAPVSQELKIVVSGQNAAAEKTVSDIYGRYLILKIVFTNGEVKIVGTPENPVVLSVQRSGKPVTTTLSTSRVSAEKAKYLAV